MLNPSPYWRLKNKRFSIFVLPNSNGHYYSYHNLGFTTNISLPDDLPINIPYVNDDLEYEVRLWDGITFVPYLFNTEKQNDSLLRLYLYDRSAVESVLFDIEKQVNKYGHKVLSQVPDENTKDVPLGIIINNITSSIEWLQIRDIVNIYNKKFLKTFESF